VSRRADLLRAAADGLDDANHPFCDEFLSGNKVTFDECFEMAEDMAAGARVLAWAIDNPRDAAAFLASGSAGMALNAVTEALARISLADRREGT
jgi:hypothetical protein